MAKTTIQVATQTRDALAAAMPDLGADTLDEAVRRLLLEHECQLSLAWLDAHPDELADYRREAQQLAEVDVRVAE